MTTTRHKGKSELDLAWLEARDRALAEVRYVARRAGDAVLTELAAMFDEAEAKGEVLDWYPAPEEIRRLWDKHVQRAVE